MIIGVLSDIHGNHYALEQTLLSAKRNKVKKLLVLGDIVGYYYYPDKVLSMLNEWDYELIRGNHEVFLKKVLNGEIELASLTEKYGSGHQLALQNLNHEQLNELINAPDKKEITLNGTKILMCHGSSWDPNYYLYPNTDEEILKRSGEINSDFVFVGHSHHPFVFENENNVLINVGSVGQSRKKGGVSNWLIFDTENKSFEPKETPYDINPLMRDIKKYNPEINYLINILKRNNDEK